MTNRYVYDDLYRLSRATGSFTGTPPQGSPAGAATASYQLSMDYDDMHRILAKRQEITQNGIAAEGVLNAGYRLGYSYSAESPFRLDTVTDANYRTVSEPSSGGYSDRHSYTYDRNGNLTGAFTDRATLGLGKSRRASERLLAWDEENRLTAVCDNGYVSAYLYDADGERVFKASGDATHMYVDAAEAPGATTDTRSFTLYVSPYLVVCEDGRYTKHFYAGPQRIVSKVGDRASYGSDPRTIDRAGNDYDSELRVDYEAKKAALEGAIAAQYEVFGVPFRGMDHDNRTDAPRRSFADPAEYEGQQYFYHPDHLGSTSYVTDADGNVAQHVEYVPFGEVLVDQRAADWNAPYLFNAKELDEETGLYYYGARYYDPRLSLWLSTDPMEEKYPDISTYTFAANNPLNYIDYEGNDIVQINNEGNVSKVILNNSNDIIVRYPNSTQIAFSSIKFASTAWEPLTGGNSKNRQIIANVFGYYAKKVGVTGVGAQAKSDNNVPAYFSLIDKKIWLNPNSDGTCDAKFNNKYNLMNTIVHESLHKTNDLNGISETHLTHAKVVLDACLHSSYALCTIDYRKSQVGYFSQLVMNAYFNDNFKEGALNLIKQYNGANLGVQLTLNEVHKKMILKYDGDSKPKNIKYRQANSSSNL